MLGPSGSGKTTCLRLIAGFEQPTAGHIEIFGETAEGVPPYRRNVNTVFQDYALFPHMTVGENVAYGLMIKGVAQAEREAQGEGCARHGQARRLSSSAARRSFPAASASAWRSPARSSTSPKVLLLDEPLGALDLKLREQMQEELKALQKQLGITFVFVTHDQGEALSMADRVAVFNEGRIVQVGTPAEVYERPRIALRRRFRRLVQCAVARLRRRPWRRGASGRASGPRRSASFADGHAVPRRQAHADGDIEMISYQGAVTRVGVDADGPRITAVVPAGASGFKPGDNGAARLAESGDGHHGGRRVSRR